MIARPPEKKFSLKTSRSLSLASKIANDNRPPKRSFVGWVFLVLGLTLFVGAVFWIYERIV